MQKINRDDAKLWTCRRAVAFAELPHRFGPVVSLPAGNLLGQIHTFEARPSPGSFLSRLDVRRATGDMNDGAIGSTPVTDQTRQAAGVNAGHGGKRHRLQPVVQVHSGAPIGGLGDGFPKNTTPSCRGCRFEVFRVGPHVADVGKGEGDDLPRVGRVGYDLLVTGDRGVKADLAGGLARGAGALAPKHFARSQHKCRFGALGAGIKKNALPRLDPGGRALGLIGGHSAMATFVR